MELWRAGVETAEIAKQMGILPGTVKCRAHTFQLQGKIEPRPRGGAYPKQKAQARQAGTSPPPAHAPVPHPWEHTKQWTVRLPQALIVVVKVQATTQGKEPSHLVEELFWQALSNCPSSRPTPTPGGPSRG